MQHSFVLLMGVAAMQLKAGKSKHLEGHSPHLLTDNAFCREFEESINGNYLSPPPSKKENKQRNIF